MLGYAPDAFPQTTERWASLVHPDDLESTLMILQPFLDGDDADYRSEYRLHAADGQWRWVLDVGRVVERDAEGKAERFMGVHIDITEQKKIELQLLKARQQAEAANQAKSGFLANMSHEIRTPLNSIIGRTHLALDNKLNQETRSHLEMISSSSENLLALVNDILDFSNIEVGKLKIKNRPFDLHDTVESCLKTIKVLVEDKDKGIEITCAVAPDVPQTVTGDALRLRQILLNLLSNSVKFTEKGSIYLFVNLLESDDDSLRLQFKVQDTGIGIVPDKLEYIFDKFVQEDDSATRQFGGTGLGLAICRQLCQLMGGDIEVVSAPDQGSTFTFTLCLQACDSKELSIKKESSKVEQADISHLFLLLVEDNEPNRILARMVLEKDEHQIIDAHDGLQALKLLNKHKFDAILMDIQMPVMDGLTAVKIIRAAERGDQVEEVEESLAMQLGTRLLGGHIPIIAVTANAMDKDREEYLAAGMDAYMAKPFNPDAFSTIFNKLAADHILAGRDKEQTTTHKSVELES
jgi:PAS domain S-box-containing protein